MILCCYCFHEVQEDTLYDKILPTIISASIVVLLFIIGRLLDNAIKANEIRRNWYQKVIIDPNIDKVNQFYNSTIRQVKLSIDKLIENKNIPFNDYIALKASEINQIKEIKREFTYEFVDLVNTNFPEIAEALSEHLRNLEDAITNCLDNQDLASDHFSQIEKDCVSKKHHIYGILYLPLKFKRPSIRRFVSYMFRRKKRL